ncbi:MAG: ribulose-phosphate 3-epimerase [Clostridia bacterium]|nr:ribulose-phosphate 3-epimerase [Clostridia bacterium]
MKFKTSPSLLAADFLHLETEVRRAEEAGADMLHCDVMDGVYVPNISFGFFIIGQIGKITSLPLDVHMMTACPQNYLEVLRDAGAASVTLHSDVMPEEELIETLKKIREMGMQAAVSLRPKCPASDAFAFVPYVDMILGMTVEPGFGGQTFMHDMMPKVAELRAYLSEHKPECEIQVDGGVSPDTVAECAKAGANNFVVGTASFRADDMGEALRGIVKTAEKAAKQI